MAKADSIDQKGPAIYDGTQDFNEWKKDMEHHLVTHQLLGFLKVSDYDGTQTFEHNGEPHPPVSTKIKKRQIVKDLGDGETSITKESQEVPVPWKESKRYLKRSQCSRILMNHLSENFKCILQGKPLIDGWKNICVSKRELNPSKRLT